jgi:hypothetical protein
VDASHTDGDGTFLSHNGNFGFTGSSPAAPTTSTAALNLADFVLGLPATFRQGGSQINNQSINASGSTLAMSGA